MANTLYGTNDPQAVKLWAKRLFREALKETYAQRFMGRDTNSLIYVKDDLNKSAGDTIYYSLRMQLTGKGVTGDATLEGNEEALTVYRDSLIIDQARNATRSGGEMSDQRVNFSVREEGLAALADWWADRIDTGFMNQISGNTNITTTIQDSGMQAPTAPTSAAGNTRILYGNGTSTTENSLSASLCYMELVNIDRAVVQAKTATPLIRPIIVNGQPKYVLFLHPNQLFRLKTDATAGLVTWYDIMRARVQGGERDVNPIFNGAAGEYNGVILHESTRVPVAVNTTDVRRAVLCGAQACCFATGRRDQGVTMKWVEEQYDYQDQLGVAASMIWGLKKSVFNGIDFGTIVLSNYAPAP